MSAAVEIVCLATRRLHDPMPTIVQHRMAAVGRRARVLYVELPADPVFLARRGRRGGAAAAGLTRVVPLVLPLERRLPAVGIVTIRSRAPSISTTCTTRCRPASPPSSPTAVSAFRPC